MAITDPLVLDLVEWVAREPRRDGEVMDLWRTSCPRLTVWEEAVERGFVERRSTAAGTFVVVTPSGKAALADDGRVGRQRPAAPAVAHSVEQPPAAPRTPLDADEPVVTVR